MTKDKGGKPYLLHKWTIFFFMTNLHSKAVTVACLEFELAANYFGMFSPSLPTLRNLFITYIFFFKQYFFILFLRLSRGNIPSVNWCVCVL